MSIEEGVIFSGQQPIFAFIAHEFEANMPVLRYKQNAKCMNSKGITISI